MRKNKIKLSAKIHKILKFLVVKYANFIRKMFLRQFSVYNLIEKRKRANISY